MPTSGTGDGGDIDKAFNSLFFFNRFKINVTTPLLGIHDDSIPSSSTFASDGR